MYDREGAKGCVGCKSHKHIKFQKLFIIPCEKTFQSKYLNDIFMTKPREIVFEGEGGMKRVLKNGYHKVCETHLISFYAKEYSCPLCNPMQNNSNQDALHC